MEKVRIARVSKGCLIFDAEISKFPFGQWVNVCDIDPSGVLVVLKMKLLKGWLKVCYRKRMRKLRGQVSLVPVKADYRVNAAIKRHTGDDLILLCREIDNSSTAW